MPALGPPARLHNCKKGFPFALPLRATLPQAEKITPLLRARPDPLTIKSPCRDPGLLLTLAPGLAFADLSGEVERRVSAPMFESGIRGLAHVDRQARPVGEEPDKAPAGLGSVAPRPARSGGLARLPHRSPYGAESHPLTVQQQARPEDSGRDEEHHDAGQHGYRQAREHLTSRCCE